MVRLIFVHLQFGDFISSPAYRRFPHTLNSKPGPPFLFFPSSRLSTFLDRISGTGKYWRKKKVWKGGEGGVKKVLFHSAQETIAETNKSILTQQFPPAKKISPPGSFSRFRDLVTLSPSEELKKSKEAAFHTSLALLYSPGYRGTFI